MTADEHITPEIRAIIGKVSGPFELELTRTSCRAFARAVGYTDPTFYDVDAARAAGHRDIPAPPGYLGTWPWSPSHLENRQFV
ncbi:MAG: MaoC family dehydratase N-terminal domain-containing protein, partial [Bryobacteraceae bacterium]